MPIRPLPEELVRHIAAGEVVERPASLIKELLENALDAGARRIRIDLEGGGIIRLKITDDGHGIAQADIPHLLARHSTSKIATFEDLSAIDSLGFRGEALYSIAAVTRFTLRTRQRDEETGTELTRDDSAGLTTKPWAGPIGTTIETRDLFYNLPARRKFLKGPTAEAARIADLVSRYCLAYPQVSFELLHNTRRMLQSLGTGEQDPLIALYGAEVAGALRPVVWRVPGLTIRGYCSPPAVQRGTRRDQSFFVNGRWIMDAGLSHAIERAYEGILPAGRHPIIILHLELPPGEVDVNVHPHKTEVRFVDARAIGHEVHAALREALNQMKLELAASAPELLRVSAEPAPPPSAYSRAPVEEYEPIFESAPTLAPPPVPPKQTPLPLTMQRPAPEPPAPVIDRETGEVLQVPTTPAGHRSLLQRLQPESYSPPSQLVANLPAPTLPLATLELRGGTWLPLREGYALIDAGEEVLAIDLPALQARLTYDALLRADADLLASQDLLFPVPLALAPALVGVLEVARPTLAELGFRIEGTPPALHAVPSLLRESDAGAALTAILEALLEDTGVAPRRADLADPLRRALASRSATRDKRWQPQEIQYLLSQVSDFGHYLSLAGTPTILRLDRDWFARMFGR